MAATGGTATAAVCRLCGSSGEQIAKGLAEFSGAHRRMERKGRMRGAEIYDDYGHHPTEIYSTLEGARHLCSGGGRLICAFQPHTFSRTAQLFDKFKTAFEYADLIILLDIYSAREVNTYGVTSQKLAEELSSAGKEAYYAPSREAAAELLRNTLKDGDVAVIMGAGDIFHISRDITEK